MVRLREWVTYDEEGERSIGFANWEIICSLEKNMGMGGSLAG